MSKNHRSKSGVKMHVETRRDSEESGDTQETKSTDPAQDVDEFDDSYLPKKNSFRIDEAARYFDVSDRTIRLWVDHGHLAAEKVVGSIRITRNSMLSCRFGRSAAGRMRI